jgi:hypothetical protein
VSARRIVFDFAVLLLTGGCDVGAGPVEEWPRFGGLDAFVEQAQPVLAARCANPSCHGRPERPLALFAVHRHRLDPADTFLDDPLTEEELRHNFNQTTAFLLDVSEPDESLLLVKPRSEHAGVVVFGDAADYDHVRLREWIELALADR